MTANGLRANTATLLANAGRTGEFQMYALLGGANNRVFKVCTNGEALLLKAYYRHPADQRDRLGAEFGFASFAWQQGIRTIPHPLACDRESGLALYEFVAGRTIRAGQVGVRDIEQALELVAALNRIGCAPGAGALPFASEACFSLRGHLDCVDGRVRRLVEASEQDDIQPEAQDFIRRNLVDAWDNTLEQFHRRAAEAGLNAGAELPRQQWCLSPSDFGFHNALREHDGRVRFLDFEYAGWDDPAKLVCDFFWQVAVPVPREYFDLFATGVVSGFDNPDEHRCRIYVLFPVYSIKWACILMNEYLPIGAERRSFAAQDQSLGERRAEQLGKARALMGDMSQPLLK
jgi:hypothetical protein